MNKRDTKAVQRMIEHLLSQIAESRARIIESGGWPNVIYIGDIFPRRKYELRPSAIKVDTCCKVFGMRIIADYRVPNNQFYIMQGEL